MAFKQFAVGRIYSSECFVVKYILFIIFRETDQLVEDLI